MKKRIVFVPGNGNASTQDNWFPYVKANLQKLGFEVVDATFPDPELARESEWIPFLKNELNVDENTVLVGHSSGAVAALRYAEQYNIGGSVLVGAYHTDLGMENEKESGYFDRKWRWQKIKENQGFIVLFASQDDPWIPVDQPRHIHAKLSCEYHEHKHQGHFGGDYKKEVFPELMLALLDNLKAEDK